MNGEEKLTMADCKWMQDEICVNADCPMRADYCPVPNDPGVCRYDEREGCDGKEDYKDVNSQINGI